MKLSANDITSMHIVIKNLIEAKSRRDNIKFTSYQLANALSMPRSIITKLTHQDEAKRISNPKIETLIKILEFFKNDGFDVSMDDLLGLSRQHIDVYSQKLFSDEVIKSIKIYTQNNPSQQIGLIDIALQNPLPINVVGFYTDADIAPFFKKGSIFIIDQDKQPENNTLIAIQLNGSQTVQFKKYSKKKNKITLHSLDDDEQEVSLMPTRPCIILGVVIHIRASM